MTAGPTHRPFDTIIRNGRWFDGTGAPAPVRHLGIRDGRVAAVSAEPLDETGCPEVVDADRPVGAARAWSTSTPTTTSRCSTARRCRSRCGTASPRCCSAPARCRPSTSAASTPATCSAGSRRSRASTSSAPSTSTKTWTHRRASTSPRSSRCRSGPTSRRSSATPTCAPRRWAWTGPPARRSRPTRRRAGADGGDARPRRSTPASSACPPSSCSSTSSTATSAARAPCPRRTPRRKEMQPLRDHAAPPRPRAPGRPGRQAARRRSSRQAFGSIGRRRASRSRPACCRPPTSRRSRS